MTYIPAALRRLVIERAENCCEYCRLSQDDDEFSFHVDHVIAEKHHGETVPENLCLSCYICNTYKGSDITSVDPQSGQVIQLYNPRTQVWSTHFKLAGTHIKPLTANGRVSASLLRFNIPERLAERALLIKLGTYPCPMVTISLAGDRTVVD